MNAAVYTHYGSPDVVKIVSVNKPVAKAHQILIRVQVATVNRTDCGFRSGRNLVSRLFSGLFRPKFPILGCEFAGQIEAIGQKVTAFKVGDRVFGYNDQSFGCHADYLTLSEKGAIAPIPTGLSYAQAAPITEGAHYALCAIRAANVSTGQNVLVYGATGAIGSAAVQLLKQMGARVTAVCNTPNVDLVKALGADTVIDYTQQDFTQNQQRFSFVFDAVGKSSFGACKPLLTDQGVYISTELGKNWENIFLALFGLIQPGKKVLFPLPTISHEDVLFLGELVRKGDFKPVIDRAFRLDQIVAAYQYVETGQKVGNVLLRMI